MRTTPSPVDLASSWAPVLPPLRKVTQSVLYSPESESKDARGEMTGRQVARVLGISPTTAIARLNDLLGWGMAECRAEGRSVLWSLPALSQRPDSGHGRSAPGLPN